VNSTQQPEVLAVIPARYASSRFPGKALTPIAGKPMVQHVVERVRQAQRITRTVVATDDDRIVQAVRGFGGEAILTRPQHRTGTERVAEVAAHTDAAIYVNVQGDEPPLVPCQISRPLSPVLPFFQSRKNSHLRLAERRTLAAEGGSQYRSLRALSKDAGSGTST
jgi:CMP-2-keto-3-deoxyoctulosonic acid synthetase